MQFVRYDHLPNKRKNVLHVVSHCQKEKTGKLVWGLKIWGQKIPEHERNYCGQQTSKKVRNDGGNSENLLEPFGKVLEKTLFSALCPPHLAQQDGAWSFTTFLAKSFLMLHI